MIGKVIKVNDYKFLYGRETVYINVYGGFIYKGSKYVIYSYDNTKLYYGTLFIRNDQIVIMTPKEEASKIIEKFIINLLNQEGDSDFQIVSLENISSAEIIDEVLVNFNVDINRLKELTIPKPKVIQNSEVKKVKTKKTPIIFVGILLIIITIITFFVMHPEIIIGNKHKYSCIKEYSHKELPSNVKEEVNLVFTPRDNILSIDITYDYLFRDTDYYKNFKDKGYFYKYMSDGDTYKFDDSSYSYRLFSKIDTEVDYFMPSKKNDLIKYYEDDGYECKKVEMSE